MSNSRAPSIEKILIKRMKKFVRIRFFFLFSLLLLLFLFILINIISDNTRGISSDTSLPQVEIKTFKINGGWGYDIFRDGPLYIHQTNIPAVSGNQFFETEEDALKIAELAKMKIIEMARKGKNDLPTITVEEIKEELK